MRNVILLGITSFLTDVSSEMIYPLVPLFLTTTLGATPLVLGFIEGVAESVASLLKVFSGALSDRLQQRKPLAIIGYSFSAIGKVLLYLAKSWGVVFCGRVADRIGKGIRTAPRDALISDSSAKDVRGKVYGLHRAMDTCGAVSGIVLAYLLMSSLKHKEEYRLVFILALIPAVLGVAVLFFTEEKIKKETSRIDYYRGLYSSWGSLDRKLKHFLVISFIFTFGNSSNMFILLRAKNVGFSSEKVILLYLLYNIIYAIVSYPAGVISDKVGKKSIIVFGYFLYSAVYLLLGIVGNSTSSLMWFAFGLYGVYMGLTEGVEKAYISVLSPVEKRATILGLHSTLVGIGLFPASLIAGFLWSRVCPSAPFFFSGLVTVIAAIGFLVYI
jgi:MFS family permease